MVMNAIGSALGKINPFSNNAQQKPEWSDQIATFVENEYVRRQTERKAFEMQWRLNMEFINGNQYLDINTATNSIEEVPKMFDWQEREVFNQIATIYETRISRLSRQKPLMKTRPASADESDLSAAKISSMLMSSCWHDQNMDSKYSSFTAWLESTSTCFFKTVWSTQKGRVVYRGMGQQMPPQDPTDETKDPIDTQSVDAQLGLDQPIVEIREGDIDSCIVPAIEVYPDSSFRNGMEDCRSFIHAKAYHVDEIEEMWGQRVDPEDVDVMTLQRASTGLGGLGYSSGQFKPSMLRLKNHAVLKEYYERPSKRYPQGRFVVVASKKTLHVGTLPFMLGDDGEPEFPFIRCVSIERPGCFWGSCVVERCIPIQRRYNALRNRKAEYLNLVAIGQWYEPENSIDDDTELNNAPGNRIRYRNVGAKPEPVAFPSLPASFENEIQTLLSEFTAISGVSELSRMSEAPSGVKSGVALSIANEQDDTRLASTATNIANAITKLGKYWIRLYRQFAQEPRLLRSVGANREVEVQQWEVSDLKSDDVIIENASALSETPSQRRQMVFDLLNAGLFNDPAHSPLSDEGRQKVFQLLEFGHWETFTDDTDLQKSKAQRENLAIMHGQMQNINDYDDDTIHIAEHNRQRMQSEYEQLMQTPYGPQIDQMMRYHVAMHQQRLAQLQQSQGMARPPAESIAFKDLPPAGQIQMAQQAGIQLTPQDIQQLQAQQKAQQQQQMKQLQSKQGGNHNGQKSQQAQSNTQNSQQANQ